MIPVDYNESVKQEHIDRVGSVDHIDNLKPGWLLVAIYKRPEKSAGGIYFTDKAKDEDNYQSCSGLVLKMGPNCFVDDENYQFHGVTAKVGDWVSFKVSETRAIDLNSRDGKCRLVQDSNIHFTTTRPDKVW